MSSYSKELLPIAGAGTGLLPQYVLLCWDVLEARGNHWRGMDPALWREWDPALWRDLSTWWRCCCKVHMVAKRDSDVPTVCQASPRGVATKAIVEADLRFNRAQGGNRRGACRFINC